MKNIYPVLTKECFTTVAVVVVVNIIIIIIIETHMLNYFLKRFYISWSEEILHSRQEPLPRKLLATLCYLHMF